MFHAFQMRIFLRQNNKILSISLNYNYRMSVNDGLRSCSGSERSAEPLSEALNNTASDA